MSIDINVLNLRQKIILRRKLDQELKIAQVRNETIPNDLIILRNELDLKIKQSGG